MVGQTAIWLFWSKQFSLFAAFKFIQKNLFFWLHFAPLANSHKLLLFLFLFLSFLSFALIWSLQKKSATKLCSHRITSKVKNVTNQRIRKRKNVFFFKREKKYTRSEYIHGLILCDVVVVVVRLCRWCWYMVQVCAVRAMCTCKRTQSGHANTATSYTIMGLRKIAKTLLYGPRGQPLRSSYGFALLKLIIISMHYQQATPRR